MKNLLLKRVAVLVAMALVVLWQTAISLSLT